MEESEIIEEALKAADNYLGHIGPRGEFNLRECVEWELKRVEKILRGERGLPLYVPLSEQNRQELDLALAYFQGPLTERTIPIQQRYEQQRMLTKINEITAQNILSEAFKETGMKVMIKCQRFRAQVLVFLENNYILRVYFPYKTLRDQAALQAKITAIRQIQEALPLLGGDTALKKKTFR